MDVNKTGILVIDEITIQSKIYIIREQKVILDFELADEKEKYELPK